VKSSGNVSVAGFLFHGVLVVTGAAALSLLFFLVLPLFQAISKPPASDLVLTSVDTAELPPPPPPPEEEHEDKPEPDEKPPELVEETEPLDLAQLELALNPGFGEGWGAGDFAVQLKVASAAGESVDDLFSLADLDQKPRVLYQPAPVRDAKMRERAPGTVKVIFIVDDRGRVESPVVQSSTDPVFERAALNAVKQWKFDPGRRGGRAVRTRMRVPITFPKD
jgi:periplasmic protein TonB